MTFYEAQNPADISKDEIIPIIKKYMPEIKAESISFFYHGTYNVFEINQKYIVRVADHEFRNAKGQKMLRRENEILNFLQNKLPLNIPEILFLSDSNEIPLSIHQKIPGKSLVFLFKQLSQVDKVEIGREIGKFLSVFHSEELMLEYFRAFPEFKNEYKSKNDFMQKFKDFWIMRYKKAKDIAYHYLNKKQQNWLSLIFDSYLENKDNFSFSPRISHCDFDTSNILIDPNKKHLTGVIDFEECKIWDPAVDLLFFGEGSEFLNAVLENYNYSNQKGLRERMKFFICRTCVPYLVWGTEHNRPGMIKEGLKIIKYNMKMFP